MASNHKRLIGHFFERKNALSSCLTVSIMLWAIIFITFGGYQKIEFFSSSCELVFDCTIVVLSCLVCKKSETRERKYFLFLSLGFLAILITDISFIYVYYILGVLEPSLLQQLFYLLPYFLYIVSQVIFWFWAAKKFIFKAKSDVLLLAPFIFSGLVILTIFLIASKWEIDYFSTVGIFELVCGFLELLLFNVLILALICSRNRGMYFLAIASAMISATNFWEMYLYQNQTLRVADYSDSFWFLALIVEIFAFIYILNSPKICVDKWFGSFRGIKSKVTLISYSFAILGFLMLCLLGYEFDLISKVSILSLPFVIMIYSLVVVLISNFIGTVFEKPFKKIQCNIKLLADGKNHQKPDELDFSTDEFSFLQKFIIDTFYVYEEKNFEKKASADLALQVAHDIRSPVTALLVLSQECSELIESHRIIMRDAANRVQDIANYLLKRCGGGVVESEEVKAFLVTSALMSVLSEKRIEFKNTNVDFLCKGISLCDFCFVEANIVDFKRVISNIINNAVEVIGDSVFGEVSVALICEGDELLITISDNGLGMSDALIDKVLTNQKIESSKASGYGFGLAHAREVLGNYDAKLHITSQNNVGTKVSLRFKAEKQPLWMTNNIKLYANDCVIILDDDPSIRGVWGELLLPIMKKYPGVESHCFKEASECTEYINNHPDPCRLLLLTDYELIGQNLSGVDVIAATGIKRSILVTSYFEDDEITKKAILLGAKLLPKMHVAGVHLDVINEVNIPSDVEAVDLIFLEDRKELSDVLVYLYEVRGKKAKACHTPYELLETLRGRDKQVKICLDYDLGCPANGLDVAKVLYEKGFANLYLATGYILDNEVIPSYVTLLENKIDLTKL